MLQTFIFLFHINGIFFIVVEDLISEITSKGYVMIQFIYIFLQEIPGSVLYFCEFLHEVKYQGLSFYIAELFVLGTCIMKNWMSFLWIRHMHMYIKVIIQKKNEIWYCFIAAPLMINIFQLIISCRKIEKCVVSFLQ